MIIKQMKKIVIFFVVVAGMSVRVFADMSEADYISKYCFEFFNGKAEIVLSDMTRCDCVTDTHAIEFEFGHKNYEAVGQSLHYARLTKKKAGIFFILSADSEPDVKGFKRATADVDYFKLPLDIWVFDNGKISYIQSPVFQIEKAIEILQTLSGVR